MAFDAKQAVADKITHLEDDLKNLEARKASAVNDFDTQIDSIKEEIDGWLKLTSADKPAAKKTAAKK